MIWNSFSFHFIQIEKTSQHFRNPGCILISTLTKNGIPTHQNQSINQSRFIEQGLMLYSLAGEGVLYPLRGRVGREGGESPRACAGRNRNSGPLGSHWGVGWGCPYQTWLPLEFAHNHTEESKTTLKLDAIGGLFTHKSIQKREWMFLFRVTLVENGVFRQMNGGVTLFCCQGVFCRGCFPYHTGLLSLFPKRFDSV